MDNTDQAIERLVERRQQLWREGGDGEEIARISQQLTDLYEDRRRERATKLHGNPAEVIRRARIETELERLMHN